MSTQKENKLSKRRWYIYIGVLLIIVSLGIGIFIFLSLDISSGSVTYTWQDRSSGECEIIEGTYYGKLGTLYLHDDRIDAYTSVRFHYTALTEGTISFYFRYDSDIGGDITMEFYSTTQMFSTLDHIQNSLVGDTWYLIALTFDCATNSGEVWIDGTLVSSGSFTIRNSDNTDAFTVRTDTTGMINVYISMISITT